MRFGDFIGKDKRAMTVRCPIAVGNFNGDRRANIFSAVAYNLSPLSPAEAVEDPAGRPR